ncbi:hypothetical protein ACTMU2_40545 [Cupriavidus basilensis]
MPDIFCMALLERFVGYYPGYSKVFAQNDNMLTWAILKAHTRNRAGIVGRCARPIRATCLISISAISRSGG